jgi:hypothetical protein
MSRNDSQIKKKAWKEILNCFGWESLLPLALSLLPSNVNRAWEGIAPQKISIKGSQVLKTHLALEYSLQKSLIQEVLIKNINN